MFWFFDICQLLVDVIYLLILVGFDVEGDLILCEVYEVIVEVVFNFEWVGYFFIIGVYGDYDGGWVDEIFLIEFVIVCG